MKKYLFFIFTVAGLLTLSFFIFYQARLRYLINPGLGVVEVKPSVLGEVIITYSNPGKSKEILRAAVLNRLVIEDYELGVIGTEDEKKPVLYLKTSFVYQGRQRELTIPIVETISFRKLVNDDLEDQGEKGVGNLGLRKGSMVNIALSYVPKDVAVEKEVVVSFCNARVYEVCLRYLKLGFGDIPIDFSEYFEQIVDNNQMVDYKIAFPNFIALLEN